jgi:hypothetical protein
MIDCSRESHNIVQLMTCDEREEFSPSQQKRYFSHSFAYVAERSDIIDCFSEFLSNLRASLTPPLKRRDYKQHENLKASKIHDFGEFLLLYHRFRAACVLGVTDENTKNVCLFRVEHSRINVN